MKPLIVGANPILNGTIGHALIVGPDGRLSEAAVTPTSDLFPGIPIIGGTPGGVFYDNSGVLGISSTVTLGTGDGPLFSAVGTVTSSGTTDATNVLNSFTVSGAGSVFQVRSTHSPMEVRTDVGTTVTTAEGYETYVRLGLANSTTGNLTAARPFAGHIANETSNAAVITRAYVFTALGPDMGDDLIPVATGTMDQVGGLLVTNQGHADRITTSAFGVKVNNMTPGAPVSAAFSTDMDTGGSRYSYYSTGQAPSIHVGAFKIGALVDPAVPNLDVGYSAVTAAAGVTRASQMVATIANGDAGGSSQLNTLLTRVVSSGTHNLALLNPTLSQVDITNTGGTIATVQGLQAVVNFSSASGTLAITNGYGIRSNINVAPSGGTTTTLNLRGFSAAMAITGTGGTTDAAFGFNVEDIDFSSGTHAINISRGLYIGGIGHATRTTNVYGIDLSDFTAGSGTTAGIRSQLTSATGKYFILGSGSAISGFAGNVSIGSTTAGTHTLELTGTVGQTYTFTPPATPATIVNDGVYTSTLASGSGTSASDVRMRRERFLIEGANAYYKVYGNYIGIEIDADVNTDAGSISYNQHLYTTLVSGTTRTANGVFTHYVFQNGSTVVATIFQAGTTNWATGVGATQNFNGFACGDLGHATRITNQLVCFNAADQTDSAAATAGQVAFLSQMTAGTERYSFRDSGGAPSALKGNLRVGNEHVLASPSTFDVTGTTHLDGNVTLGGLFNPTVSLSLTGTATFTSLSDAATTTPLTLINGGASAGTAVQLRMAPKEVDLSVGALRAGQIVTTLNSGAITMEFQVSNGAVPATALTINPTKYVSFATFLELPNNGTPSAPASGSVRIYEDTQGGKNRVMALFSSGIAQVMATQP